MKAVIWEKPVGILDENYTKKKLCFLIISKDIREVRLLQHLNDQWEVCGW